MSFNELFSQIYIEGDILGTFVNLFILVIACDCIFGVAKALGNIKNSVI